MLFHLTKRLTFLIQIKHHNPPVFNVHSERLRVPVCERTLNQELLRADRVNWSRLCILKQMALRFNIRPATPDDRDFVLSIAPRLNEFDLPPWRDRVDMNRGDARVLGSVLSDPPAETAVFIAETEDGAPLGFIHLNVETDYYTNEEFGHISDIVVAPEGEGQGVGRALMAAGEDWARSKGYRLITLHVFTENTRARALYERLGYGEDFLKYIKAL